MQTRVALALVLLVAGPVAAGRSPTVGAPTVFAPEVAGPEGIAFEKNGRLVAGTVAGQILRFRSDGTRTVVGDVGEPLAGITVLRDGRILAASFGPARVWAVDPRSGAATVLASNVPGANYIVETKQRRVLVSASSAGTVVDVTDGTPVERASELSFPNGMALGPKKSLYVAQLLAGNVVRLPLARDGTLGAPEVYATGVAGVDGIGFDKKGNLLAVGADTLYLVPRGGGTAEALSTHELLDWPSNLAFAKGRGFGRDLFLVNFGFPLGSGTTILRLPYGRRR
jgi:sugar lactone lactonase YvrE